MRPIFDGQNLYFTVATSDPAALPNFSSDADLVPFEPYLRQIMSGLRLP